MTKEELQKKAADRIDMYLQDWNLFAVEVLGVYLDPEQAAVLTSVQNNKRTSVRSGTSRGKDFVAAVAAVCFFYLTPKWNERGEMVENTKVAMSAPTERQVIDIMGAEVGRLFSRAKGRDMGLPGRLVGAGIRTDNKEWFLTGFKADDRNLESWTGFHAANTMFVITEASGMPDLVFNAIEGNLHGNSRILIVFNDNTGAGYASNTQKSDKWSKFRLDSLNAPNVLHKRDIIPGQVSWETINEQVRMWCSPINETDFLETEGDFFWTNELGENRCYRPSDLFRVKVRGMAPKVSTDVLVPYEWIEAANKRWEEESKRVKDIEPEKVSTHNIEEPRYLPHTVITPYYPGDGTVREFQNIISVPNPNYSLVKRREENPRAKQVQLRLGCDIAGMGRDNSAFCHRYSDYVEKFEVSHGGGDPETLMKVTGKISHILVNQRSRAHEILPSAFIDSVGEGAGVYSRLMEQRVPRVYSVKSSYSAEWPEYKPKPLTDITGQYEFANMRAYLYWCVRDWLNPAHKSKAALPPDSELAEELSQTKWSFMSNGKVKIESKEDLKSRLKRSPDKADALAMTFFPVEDYDAVAEQRRRIALANLAAII